MSSFDFVEKVMTIGGTGSEGPTLQFYKKGFVIGSGSVEPTWRDIILSGNTALTLVNSKANGLNYVKLFGATEQRNLPSEYTQVEYIESTGTQYIDTGVVPAIGIRTKIKYAYMSTSGYGYAFGDQETGGHYFALRLNNSSKLQFLAGESVIATDITAISYTPFTAELSVSATSATYIVNDISNTETIQFSIESGTRHIGVFANGTGENAFRTSARCYELLIDKNGVLVRNMVPAKRNSDNVVGMYDLVSGQFFTNQGTGTFIAGADVVPSPDTPMDIWCNNGVLKFGALGKNLFNPTKVLFGYYRDRTTGIKQQSSSNFMSSDDGYIPCLPNTTYTFVGTNKTNGTYSKYNTIYLFDSAKNYLGASSYEISQPITATTPNDCYYLQVRSNPLDNSTPIQDAFAQFDWQLEQGSTATPYEPYRAGIYTDGTVETVEATGKNLFDVDNNLLAGYYINTTTGILTLSSDGSSSCFKDFLPSKPNITYTMSRLLGKSTALRMWAYDKDKNPISLVFNSELGAKEITGTTPNDTAYIRCSFGSIPQYSQNIQLEQGSTATTYEPYFNGGNATAEMLLKVGNYQDIQSVLDGGVTRNVGIKVLDGTENWNESGTGLYGLTISDKATVQVSSPCSHFKGTNKPKGELLNLEMGTVNVTSSLNTICIRYDEMDTITKFKQFLSDQYAQGTPVIIVYPLATPTTETVTPQPLSIQAGTNIITAEGSIDNLPLEVSYKAGVAVTITEVQNAQLDNNVEVIVNG